ncbi:Cof-type HAD-IIB family hydrolase [Virgibacillus necropolis]|uniref:Phosphoglycolate phosphatase n=1 Tax=Virgibacillus necropolis TaxID=163877 RepID=A0A221MAS3_9BACI|nr:Cof-type HAD-IIB family hydrolase [Virgibacillus necropolis]ASN04700.1 phosphoglycolate phosphatase [Virgibacillus necropolis]
MSMHKLEKPIRLIALDMDGTLLTSDEQVTERTRKAIKQAMEKDVHVVISTGRWLGSCYPYAESLGLQSYLVTSNGGEIWTMEKELIERHTVDPEVMEKMWNLGEKYDMGCWMIATDAVWRGERPNDFSKPEWLKVGFDSHIPSNLEKFMQELSYFDGLELTNSQPHNVEVNPKGVHKASALHKVCEKLGTTMEEVMSVGDSLNDMKMIQQAGLGVAMGNAQEAIKKAADFETDTNDRDGVAKVIEHFVLD